MSKEPVCVYCESLKERVVWLVIWLLYGTVSVFVFVYSGIKYSSSIINGGLSEMSKHSRDLLKTLSRHLHLWTDGLTGADPGNTS